jgi:hypothetical protein
MYCANCGAESTFGLKFCKRCGASLADATQSPAPVPAGRITSAAWALALATVAICLGGLGIIFTHAFDIMSPLSPGLTRTGDPMPIAILMIIFGSLSVFGICALLIKLFARLLLAPQETPRPASLNNRGVVAPPPAQIAAPPRHISSVTENTTRNFDKSLYEEPRARD